MKAKKIKKEKAIPKVLSEPLASYENIDFFSGIIALLGGQRLIKYEIKKVEYKTIWNLIIQIFLRITTDVCLLWSGIVAHWAVPVPWSNHALW